MCTHTHTHAHAHTHTHAGFSPGAVTSPPVPVWPLRVAYKTCRYPQEEEWEGPDHKVALRSEQSFSSLR